MSSKIDRLLEVVFQTSDRFPYEVGKDGIVTVLEKQDHKIQCFFRKLRFRIPEYKKTDLDAFGSYVFLQIDGNRTVREIGENLETRYGDQVQPLYERLSLFLNYLSGNCHYIERTNGATDSAAK